MRDLLEKLQTISKEQEDHEPEFHGPENDVDNVTLSQEAVVFDKSAIENLLMEVHGIRKDMSLLNVQVERLKKHNDRFRTTMRRLTLLKKDSDSIARGIQQHGEALYVRIQALGNESRRLEEKSGPLSTVSRIARVQHDALMCAFHDTMSEYNKAEEMQRDACRERLKRQASIMGTEITNEQLDEMVDKGGEGWDELSQNVQTTRNRTLRRAMVELQGRHKELLELEARLRDVHELFRHMAMLVEEQGSVLNNIEANVCTSEEHVDESNVRLRKGIEYKKKNPFQTCCSCLPCWRCNQTA
ncbi:syntaxin-11-like [Micropterus dolomieu]|uniref:syntaxin-11-like n=1 Tax=Micropterus dolomieu TaxID=147949 RepID=UPI001E8DD08B|nr:syntaxin-11-like [Micropterus dolomieu]